jgi:hypothetical protein
VPHSNCSYGPWVGDVQDHAGEAPDRRSFSKVKIRGKHNCAFAQECLQDTATNALRRARDEARLAFKAIQDVFSDVQRICVLDMVRM